MDYEKSGNSGNADLGYLMASSEIGVPIVPEEGPGHAEHSGGSTESETLLTGFNGL